MGRSGPMSIYPLQFCGWVWRVPLDSIRNCVQCNQWKSLYVQLKNKEKFLIGTQQSEELEKFISTLDRLS